MLEISFLMGLLALFCAYMAARNLHQVIKDIQDRIAKLEAGRNKDSSIHIPAGPMQGTWRPEEKEKVDTEGFPPQFLIEVFDYKTNACPLGFHPWPDDKGHQPRDASWGYVQTPEGRKHVHNGDQIVTDESGDVVRLIKRNV